MAENLKENNRLRGQENELMRIGASLAAQFTEQARGLTEELKEQIGIRSRYTEEEKGVLSLSRKIISSARENNLILRKQNSLRSQINKDTRIRSELETEIQSVLLNQGLNTGKLSTNARRLQTIQSSIQDLQAGSEQLLIRINNAVGVQKKLLISQRSELLQNIAVLEDEYKALVNNSSQSEKRLSVLFASKDTVDSIVKSRKDELDVDNKVNKTLGITGAILENLNKLGVRAFGGIGINLGTFSEAIESGKEKMQDLGDAFVRLDRLVNTSNKSVDELNASISNQKESLSSSVQQQETLFSQIKKRTGLEEGLVFAYSQQVGTLATLQERLKDANVTNREREAITKRIEKIQNEVIASDEKERRLKAEINKELQAGTVNSKINANQLKSELNKYTEERFSLLQQITQEELNGIRNTSESISLQEAELENLRTLKGERLSLAKELVPVLGKEEKKEFLNLLAEERTLNNQILDLRTELDSLEDLGRSVTPEESSRINELVSKIKELESDIDKAASSIEKFSDKTIEAGKSTGKLSRKWLNLKQTLPEIGEALTEAFLDPLLPATLAVKAIKFTVNGIVTAFKEVDKSSTNFQRLTGRAGADVAVLNDRLITASETLDYMSSLTEKLGFDVQAIFTPQQLGALAEAEKGFGLSKDQANALAITVKTTGATLEEFEKSFFRGVKRANQLNRSAVAGGTAFREILNTSSDIRISFLENNEALGEAVATAKTLGLTLEQINKVADSLIDFESSITNELMAQVITGEQLNLSRARFLALNNDLIGLGQEIERQGITALKFSRMDRIERESIAKALGLSKEELAEALLTQKTAANLTREQQRAVLDLNEEQFKAFETTQAFETATKKLFQAFTPLIVSVTPFIESLARVMTKVANTLGNISSGLGSLIPGLKDNEKATRMIADALTTVLVVGGGIYLLVKSFNILKGAVLGVKGAIMFLTGTASAAATATTALTGAGTGLSGVMTGLGRVLPFVGRSLASFGMSVGLAGAGAIKAIPIIAAVGAAAVGIGYGLKLASSFIKELYEGITKVATVVKDLLLGAIEKVPIAFRSMIDSFKELFPLITVRNLGKIGLFSIEIYNLSKSLKQLGKNSNLAIPILDKIKESFNTSPNIPLETSLGTIESSIERASIKVSSLGDSFKTSLEGIPTVISNLIPDNLFLSLETSLGNIESSIERASIKVSSLGDSFKTSLEGIPNLVQEISKSVDEMFTKIGILDLGKLFLLENIADRSREVPTVNIPELEYQTQPPEIQTMSTIVESNPRFNSEETIIKKLTEENELLKVQNETSTNILNSLRVLTGIVEKGGNISVDGRKLQEAFLLSSFKSG